MALKKNRFYFPNKVYFDNLAKEMSGNQPPCVVFTPKALPYSPVSVGITDVDSALNAIVEAAKSAFFGTNRNEIKKKMYFITPKDFSDSGALSNPDGKNVKQTYTAGVDKTGEQVVPTYSTASSDSANVGENKPIQIVLPLKPFASGITHTWDDSKDMIAGALNGVGQAITTAAIEKVGELLGTDDLMKMQQANGGAFVIAATRKTYSGSSLQDFSFDFDFVPTNPQEAKEALDIINIFRFLSMPQAPPGSATNPIAIGRMPAIWNMKIYGLPDNMVKLNNEYPFMVCGGLNVTYGAGDFYSGFKYGGTNNDAKLYPNLIKMTFTMTEFFSNHSAQEYFGSINSNLAS